jgi:hypothetical protein
MRFCVLSLEKSWWFTLMIYLLIYNKSIDKHIDHLRDVFNALRDAHLFGNLEKCTFCTDRVSFLGYVVTPQGIEADHAKVEDMPYCLSQKTSHRCEGF